MGRPRWQKDCKGNKLPKLAKSNGGNIGSRQTMPYAKREKSDQAELLRGKELPKLMKSRTNMKKPGVDKP